MGRKNDELAWYLNRPVILSDFFNGCLYSGKRVILPEELAEMQKNYHENMRARNGKVRRTRRERDAAGLLCRKGHFAILAVENQDRPNLCMPLRCLEYDVEDFVRQLRRLKRRYQQEGGLKQGMEYLSGIKEGDRLIPSVTLVFYHGEGEWTAPVALQEMLDMGSMDETLKALHMEYRIRVIRLSDLKEEWFETGLRELIGMMKRKNDKEAMLSWCRENETRFRNMDDETYDLICTMIHYKTLAFRKEKCRNQGKETVDMCKAIEDMIKDGKMEGEKIGEKIGEKRGEEKLGQLISHLLRDGRTADAGKAAESVRVRRRLYKEYGIGI